MAAAKGIKVSEALTNARRGSSYVKGYIGIAGNERADEFSLIGRWVSVPELWTPQVSPIPFADYLEAGYRQIIGWRSHSSNTYTSPSLSAARKASRAFSASIFPSCASDSACLAAL